MRQCDAVAQTPPPIPHHAAYTHLPPPLLRYSHILLHSVVPWKGPICRPKAIYLIHRGVFRPAATSTSTQTVFLLNVCFPQNVTSPGSKESPTTRRNRMARTAARQCSSARACTWLRLTDTPPLTGHRSACCRRRGRSCLGDGVR